MKKIALIAILFLLAVPCLADVKIDSDKDGLFDEDEINIYHTNFLNPDTDGDGYSDGVEVAAGYSALNTEKVKTKNNDYDHDGLNDEQEIKFKTDLTNPDTDGDGYKDGEEINSGHDPLNSQAGVKLLKQIEINIKNQELSYFLAGVEMGTFKVSTGKPSTPTPKGEFKILNKAPKAWSPYGLWMPYWIGLGQGKFGIHELPVWPNGYREGESHLGIPVSHGCIRLGIGPAKLIYNWAEIGMIVKIY